MAHRADGLNDIFEHNVIVRENLKTTSGQIGTTPVGDSDIANKKYVDDSAGISNHSSLTELDYVSAGHTGFAPALGADDNYVTDAEKIVIGNTSGTNTGDQTSSDFDHNSLTNTHNLTTDINHTNIQNIGTNTHAQIDTAITASTNHIADSTNPHGATLTQNELIISGSHLTKEDEYVGNLIYINENEDEPNSEDYQLGSLLIKFTDYQKLLLHCDGTDGSTTIPDVSSSNNTITAHGNARLRTAQKYFGSASCYFDGTGDYLTIPNSSDWDFLDNNFTIDFWFYGTLDEWMSIMDWSADGSSGWSTRKLTISLGGAGSGSSDKVDIRFYTEAGANCRQITSSVTLSGNTWTHIALVRNGANLDLYINGTNRGNVGVAAESANDIVTPLYIGYNREGSFNETMNGYLDEIRVCNGVAKWTANFTPETAEYPSEWKTITAIKLNR